MKQPLRMRANSMPRRQAGTVLVISLVILLVLTLLGVASMQTSALQEKMAGNLHDTNLAFQSAEGALRVAEDFLQSPVLPSFNGSNGLHRYDGTPAVPSAFDLARNPALWPASSVAVGDNAAYFIVELPPVPPAGSSARKGIAVPDTSFYRVIARAEGGSAEAGAIIETTFKR